MAKICFEIAVEDVEAVEGFSEKRHAKIFQCLAVEVVEAVEDILRKGWQKFVLK